MKHNITFRKYGPNKMYMRLQFYILNCHRSYWKYSLKGPFAFVVNILKLFPFSQLNSPRKYGPTDPEAFAV